MTSPFTSRVSELQLVSAQRWVLALLAVAAAVGASAAASTSDGGSAGPVLFLVAGLSIASMVRPDTHVALVVAVIVIAQCISNDDVTTPWTIAVAIGLLVFHSVTALSAITPLDACIDTVVVRRWSLRVAAAGSATAAMWVLVDVLARRDAAGSVVLTFLGFAVLIVLIVAVRALVVRSAEASN